MVSQLSTSLYGSSILKILDCIRIHFTLVVVSPPVETQVWPNILSYLRMEFLEYWLVSKNFCGAASGFLLMMTHYSVLRNEE